MIRPDPLTRLDCWFEAIPRWAQFLAGVAFFAAYWAVMLAVAISSN